MRKIAQKALLIVAILFALPSFAGPVVNYGITTYTSTTKTVTNASTTLLAANNARKVLIIQNNDGAGIVYVNFQASTATTANSYKLAPGGAFQITQNAPLGAITAIGSIASNANVIVIEGQ